MSTYKIRIILNSGTGSWFADEIIENTTLISASGNNYQFRDDNNKWKYYPVSYTIVEQMDDPKINLDL